MESSNTKSADDGKSYKTSADNNNDSQSHLTLGKLRLSSKYLLAPMEEVSDVGFRALCAKNGAGLTYTEMVRAAGIVRKNKATLDLIDTFDKDTPTGLQLFAANERELGVALYELDKLASTTHPHFKNIKAIDLNFGCPSPDIIRMGAGPALLKRTNKMRLMFDKLSHWRSSTSMPIGAISAKIRLGLNQQEQDHKVYLRLIEAANDNLDFLIVHPRHAKQKSSDLPSWNSITEIKSSAKIPIIGNGNVFCYTDAKRMFDKTGCDGIMIARGAIQNPWVFRDLNKLSEIIPRTSRSEILQAMQEYDQMSKRFSTKQKYIEFHKSNFEKLLAQANQNS